MVLSIASLITIMVICDLSILALSFYLNKYERIQQIGVNGALIGILLLHLRLLIPFEFPFQYTIAEKLVLPSVFTILYFPIFKFHTYYLYIHHIFLLVWLLGAMIIGIRTIFIYVKFKKALQTNLESDNTFIKDIITSLEKPYGKISNFSVIKSDLITAPLLFGIFKPYIVLPNIELSERDLYYILKHEITHYYYHDLWIKCFVEVIAIIYWWNPLIYILKQQIDKIFEIRVDLAITKQLDESKKIHYLECLLFIAKENTTSKVNYFVLTFNSESASVLAQRFHIVLDDNPRKKSPAKNLIVLLISALILALISVVVLEPYSISYIDQQQTVELTTETSFLVINPNGGYDIYLNGDYFGTVSEIKDSYSNLHIFKNAKEGFSYENKK